MFPGKFRTDFLSNSAMQLTLTLDRYRLKEVCNKYTEHCSLAELIGWERERSKVCRACASLITHLPPITSKSQHISLINFNHRNFLPDGWTPLSAYIWSARQLNGQVHIVLNIYSLHQGLLSYSPLRLRWCIANIASFGPMVVNHQKSLTMVSVIFLNIFLPKAVYPAIQLNHL